MKRITFLLGILLTVVLFQVGFVQAAVETGAMAPDFTLTDTQGNSHSLSDFKGKHVVLEWVNYECPFVKKHYVPGNMQNLQAEWTGKGVVWLSINSSAEGKQGFYTPAQVNEIMDNSSAKPTAYLVDTSGEVGKLYGAKTTPHMFVINPEGKLLYQGAIDSNPSFDSADIAGATNYVSAALNQSMAGDALTNPSTKAYGCSVKY